MVASGDAPIGRRKRRLRRVASLVTATALVAVFLALWAYRANRPRTRVPGEALDDITSRLALDLPPEAPDPSFTDVTSAAGLDSFAAFAGGRSSQLPEDMGSGLAWGDFDGDGDDDLFAVSAGGALGRDAAELAPSRLFENLGDGTFRPYSGFPETRIHGMGAAWGDYDGDGRLDLALSGFGTLTLYRNEGERFVVDRRLPAPEGFWAGVAWGDYDGDRDLDLYVCGYVRYEVEAAGGRRATEQYGQAVPYTLNPASFEAESNLLWVNRLDEGAAEGFSEEAVLWGVSNPEGRSLSALWHDFDADGRLDLYVANDISDNALYLNRGDTFEDAGLSAWVADYRGAMGLAAGDWNRDGDDDLFVTHWVAQENALYDSRLLEMPGRLTFADMAAPLGLGQPALQFVGWGTEFGDLDGDGWLDLVVANGSTFETEDDPPRLEGQEPFFFWNHGGRSFHDLAPLSESLARARVGRGLALSDYDADGDLDLALIDLGAGVRLLRNDMRTGNWLGIRLRSRGRRGGASTGWGEGSTVVARVGEVALRRVVGGASYLSQSSLTLHFGLGDAAAVDEVEVFWLGGERQVYPRLEAGAIWELVEGDPVPRRRARSAVAGGEGEEEADRRARVVRFWDTQRAAMDAMKIDSDLPRAAALFRQALELNPEHQDSRYYLANCLAALGRTAEALDELEELARRNPASSRAHRQRGMLLALSGESAEDLAAAGAALEKALAINREETGALQALGEVALLQGDLDLAEQRLEWVSRTNASAVGALFLRGYLAWRNGDEAAARSRLEAAAAALGGDWKPRGTTAEGDVAVQMHQEMSPLARFWQEWDGRPDPGTAYTDLHRHLTGRGRS